MPSSYDSFESDVINRFFRNGRTYSQYLSDAATVPDRAHDEQPVVDELMRYVLEWLGFRKGNGADDWDYNDTKSHVRPDYEVKIAPAHVVFVVEDKNTATDSLSSHSPQLAEYVQMCGARYGLLCNGRQIIAYEFDKTLQPKAILTLDMESEFSDATGLSLPLPGLTFADAVSLFFQLFHRDRFTSTSRPAVELVCPACGSADVRSVSLIWKEIMSGAQPSSDVLAAGLAQALVDRSAVRALSKERQASLLANELAPPQKLHDLPVAWSCRQMLTGILMMLASLALIGAGVLRIVAKHLMIGQIVTTVLGSLVVAAVGYVSLRAGAPKPTFKQYADRVTAWNCMFLCVKCGNRFVQGV